ncbi:hypothetical protein ACTVCO_01890 [Sanguibacter sp. A247]|uniref:hypothetical protein n=1 Tax=unclassified Sanguibacter TaxID=2645534 RepID=UPI003FD81D91
MSTHPLASETETLRARRRALRAEMKRIQHWRRLLRARIDLSVSAALLPDRLGLVATGPLGQITPPDHVRMTTLVRGGLPTAAVLDLAELRDLENEVQEYGHRVRSELERVTEMLVQRLTEDLVTGPAHLSSLF